MAKFTIPVSDENENWLNTVRGQKAPEAGDDAVVESAREMSIAPADGEDDDQIAEIVAQYKTGELPFEEALGQLAATSLTWHEAQILLGDEDGDGVPDDAPADPTAPQMSDYERKP